MNKFQTFEQFLATQSSELSIQSFVINLFLTILLSYLLGRIYTKFGNSLSNRKMFSNNFILLAMTTMLIITIVKSSLALSLGLVGALSIVRFRAAIKEPEELSFLFLVIGLGLGLGANQRLTTVIAFTVISLVIIVKNYRNRARDVQNLNLGITCPNLKQNELQHIVEILREHCSAVNIKRFDETSEIIEASFLIECDGFDRLDTMKKTLRKYNDDMRITFLDNKGIIY